jgi:AraC-like DNA-binding protein
MLSTMELADVALACGFVDQSHFSRVFASIEKMSPGQMAASAPTLAVACARARHDFRRAARARRVILE